MIGRMADAQNTRLFTGRTWSLPFTANHHSGFRRIEKLYCPVLPVRVKLARHHQMVCSGIPPLQPLRLASASFRHRAP